MVQPSEPLNPPFVITVDALELNVGGAKNERISTGKKTHALGRSLIVLLPILNLCPLPTETILHHAIYNVCN
jgi:hypothetical protein